MLIIWFSLDDLIIWLLQVVNQADLLFSEVLNTLRQIAEKISAVGTINSMRKMELRRQIAGLEAVLQKEKAKFEVSLQELWM